MGLTSGQNTDFARGFELLKRVYADKVEDLVPETDRLAKDVPFIAAEKQPGQDYYQPVTLTREGGATFWNTGAIQQLNQPLSTAELSSSIRGAEIAVRSALSYKFLHSALKQLDGTSRGARAFVNATKDRFEKLTKGASYFRECMLLYGGGAAPSPVSNLGVVLTTTGTAGASLVIQMAPKDYATALWTGSEGLEFDIYSTAGAKRNAAGTGATALFKLVSTTPSLYQVTFASDAANVAAVVATDQIFFAGARGNDALGFVGAAATQAGNLWGISTSTYALWRPTVVDLAGAPMNFAAVSEAGARVAATGFSGDYDLYVNPATFSDICDDQTALVTHTTKSSGKITIGFDDVAFKSQAGLTHLKVHPYMKRGIALGLPRGYCSRVGATDLTHTMPGFGKMFRELENASGVEMRLYGDFAAYSKNPQYLQLFVNIANTSD
jgi:hypothetical protein